MLACAYGVATFLAKRKRVYFSNYQLIFGRLIAHNPIVMNHLDDDDDDDVDAD